MDKYTKDDCNYRPGDWPHECGTCVHYKEGKKYSSCRIVHGKIIEDWLCDFWAEPKGKRIDKKIPERGSSVHTDPWSGFPFPRGGAVKSDETADFFDWIERH